MDVTPSSIPQTSNASSIGDPASLEQAIGKLVRSSAQYHTASRASIEPAGERLPLVRPALTEAERIGLEEDTEECMADTPMYVCFEKFGSYGIRRLHTEEWEDIVKMGYERPNWMEHENVQRRHLFNLTFPGTHGSGTYDVVGSHAILGTGLAFGVETQHLSIDRQLEAGIRAFDLRISYSPSEKRLYASHMLLTVPLAEILGQMRAFLDKRPKEIILVTAKVGRTSHKIDARHRDVITAEDNDPTKVPGQMVHHLFLYHLGSLLATYATLSKLPVGESWENPRISSLAEINARVLYFWEGQQVLCTDRQMCERTPGWTRPWGGLAFGWPLAFGDRARHASQSVEPACLMSAWESTASAHPDLVVKRSRSWLLDLYKSAAEAAPACFPTGAPIPPLHTPTLLYWVDGQVTLTEAENGAQRLLLQQAKAWFTRGEGFGLMSSAERANYLMLVWLMKKGSRPLWTRASVLAQDFVSPILVHRIIEAMQEQQDCGWAMTCKVSGSCWAASLLAPDGSCRPEEEVQAELEEHAASKGGVLWRLLLAALLALGLGLGLASACCAAAGRRPKGPPPGAAPPPPGAAPAPAPEPPPAAAPRAAPSGAPGA